MSFKNIISTISSISQKNELIILGDFNKNWLNKSSSKERNLLNNLNLTQLIKQPTRITPQSQSLLDWILVSHPSRFSKVGVMSDCFSDHSIVNCVWKIKLPKVAPKMTNIRQHKKLNLDLFINDLLAINWDRFQLISDVQDAWDFFLSEFTKVVDKHAPWKVVKVKGRHLPWISPELIDLFRQRDKAWATYRQTRDNADWEIYRQLRNLSKPKTSNAKFTYYNE